MDGGDTGRRSGRMIKRPEKVLGLCGEEVETRTRRTWPRLQGVGGGVGHSSRACLQYLSR